jgi:zinc and cadmium transporter
MDTFTLMVLFSLIGGVFSLIGGVILLGNPKTAKALAQYATPFAGGALLAAVFLDLLKEGIEADGADRVLLATLLGVICFFFLEGVLHWFHHHHAHQNDTDPKALLIIIGDVLHNALDGVAIAASFLVSVPTGIVTTIAVAVHEIPQEIGDFGLLLSKGMSRKRVLLVNIVSALATTVAAVLTYWLGDSDVLPLGVLLGFSAGFLLYIATSDVIPTIHADHPKKRFFDPKVLLFILGVLVVGIVTTVAHQYIGAEHQNHQHSAEQADCTHYYDKDGAEELWRDCQ